MSMSTLLELKSSVLRQVQSRQSFRRRADTVASPGSFGNPETSNRESSATRSDHDNGEFFERLKIILQKQEAMQRSTRSEVSMESRPPPPESTGQNRGPQYQGLSRRELDLLYEEAVYTVVNRVGVTSPDYVTNEEDLFSYLQEVFQVGPDEHDIILQRVKEAKRTSYSLKVSVKEGRNLLAKDANGYSDPYCMLGILLGQSPKDPEEKKERKFSFRKKKDKIEKKSSIRDVLPAKVIQVTEVKPETLNPVWNETFTFEIDDVYNDQLHLDIWDHDDDVSVADACKKLNEVSGFKGMGRYFKQIAKSVRANGTAGSAVEENVDDFLGCLNIGINEIPVEGVDRWFKLEPRSSASSVQGECHLALKLISSQRDTSLSKKESYVTIHKLFLRQIIEYEHAQIKIDSYAWKGQLSKPAWTVLSHHAAQIDLSPLHRVILQWQSFSKHHEVESLDYSYLLELLKNIEEKWTTDVLSTELERSLAESFTSFREYCLALLKNLRELFPVNRPRAITRLDYMLRCLNQIHCLQAFKTLCPFHNELHVEITTVLKKSTLEWYERLASSLKPDEGPSLEQLRILVRIIDAVYADVQRDYHVYNQLFYSTVKADYFSITYRQLEKLAADDISAAMEKVCGMLEQEGCKLVQSMGETLFELYITLKALKQFQEFLPTKDSKCLSLASFHNWFQSFIHKWLQIVHEKCCERIKKAVEVDKMEHVDTLSKHSSSAVDVTSCLTEVKEFWVQLAWPDAAGAFVFLTRLTDAYVNITSMVKAIYNHFREAIIISHQSGKDICSAVVWYSELIKHKTERGQQGQESKRITNQLCIALNNIEHVRRFICNLPRDLDWNSLEAAMEESSGADSKEQVHKALSAQLLNIDVDLRREAKRMIAHLTDKMVADLKKYIQHISLSPDSIHNDEAISPLMKYLDDTLIILSGSLVKENLSRVLQGLWALLLKLILDTVAENRGVSLEFYGRFYYTVEALVEFFHAEGVGLPVEELKNEEYKMLEEELRLNKCSSNELIEQYYTEKIALQKTLRQSRYGRISVKCYYEASEQKLYVEILHAADLIALDANGLSDPFVIIEVCPHHIFPMSRSQRTQVKHKTLHPVFDELFVFHVTQEQHKKKSACILFTIMDHDWLSANDFAGEAVLSLTDCCGSDKPTTHGGVKNAQPLILHLARPKPSEKPILKMLEARSTDREAQEFVKKLKELEKSMGETD